MLLYCDYTQTPAVVVARYADGTTLPAGAHPNTTPVTYEGDLGALGRVGPAPADGMPDVRPIAAPPLDLKAYAAAARYSKETGGITVGNAPIATDRDSQQMINGMWAAAQINPNISVQFKSAGGGFATITAGQINAIASAVVAHVQTCFAAEAQIDAAITAGTVTTTAQVDQAFAAITV